LGVVTDQLDLPSKKAASRVGLFDRERESIDHRLAVDIQSAREIVDARYANRVFRPGAAGRKRAGSGGGRTL
jgi:hypothetical protein